jgi:hypothetical protein
MISLNRTDLTQGKYLKNRIAWALNNILCRFGRWRGWIEKRSVSLSMVSLCIYLTSAVYRAAERYADITPEERDRRRERGWDLQRPSQVSDDF